MLFSSYPFIFVFLPVVLFGYFVAGRVNALAPVIWLALASLVFYAFSNWPFVALLLASIAFNYLIGWLLISRNLRAGARSAVLAAGVSGDLLALGVFKYAGFLVANFNAVFSTTFAVNILLPVGISFYTFTQIAFLVDAYRGKVARYALPHYALFVTYFPHLIAGPILHHRDMIPQFEAAEFETAESASDPVWPDHFRRSACSRRRCLPTASSHWSRSPSIRHRRRSIRPGSARLPTPFSSISISPAIPTWRSECR